MGDLKQGENLQDFWHEILPDVRAALGITEQEVDAYDIYQEITETYLRNLKMDSLSDEVQTLIAGNVRQFMSGIMRPLLTISKVQLSLLRGDYDKLLEEHEFLFNTCKTSLAIEQSVTQGQERELREGYLEKLQHAVSLGPKGQDDANG